MKSGLTHTVTHTAKGPKSGGEDIRLILSAALLFFHHLCHEIAHLLRGTFLHLPRNVGVGAGVKPASKCPSILDPVFNQFLRKLRTVKTVLFLAAKKACKHVRRSFHSEGPIPCMRRLRHFF